MINIDYIHRFDQAQNRTNKEVLRKARLRQLGASMLSIGAIVSASLAFNANNVDLDNMTVNEMVAYSMDRFNNFTAPNDYPILNKSLAVDRLTLSSNPTVYRSPFEHDEVIIGINHQHPVGVVVKDDSIKHRTAYISRPTETQRNYLAQVYPDPLGILVRNVNDVPVVYINTHTMSEENFTKEMQSDPELYNNLLYFYTLHETAHNYAHSFKDFDLSTHDSERIADISAMLQLKKDIPNNEWEKIIDKMIDWRDRHQTNPHYKLTEVEDTHNTSEHLSQIKRAISTLNIQKLESEKIVPLAVKLTNLINHNKLNSYQNNAEKTHLAISQLVSANIEAQPNNKSEMFAKNTADKTINKSVKNYN